MKLVDLTTVLRSHKFDKMNVDTKRAEQYLEANKAGFTGNLSDINYVNNLKCEIDSYGNKINCDIKEIPDYESKPIHNNKLAQYSQEFLKELAEKIEKETDLFCQLEYLIRKIPINDTKQSINLIVRSLISTGGSIPLYPKGKAILIEDSTPLLFLGSISQLLVHGCFTLVASKETAVICHLFTKICEAHHNCPNFIFQIGDSKTIEDNVSFFTKFDYSLTQITGIVTERSDIDSAVSSFLDSDYHPFPITRIVVQENIYEEFKNIIAWQCKSKEEESKKIDEKIKSKCTDVFSYKNKLFLLDFADKIEKLDNAVKGVVLVEAYRTTNELLSLIKMSIKPNCISLWASGVSEANEIALNINAPFIWINDCCNFDGPNLIPRVIFREILVNPQTIAVSDAVITELTQKQVVWSKKSFHQRYNEVLDAINKTDTGFGTKFASKIPILKISNDVSVVKNSMILYFYDPDNVLGFTYDCYVLALKALVNGKAIVIGKITDIVADLFQKLAEAGVPVAVIDDKITEAKLPKQALKLAHTKYIWTNFGTKFAN